ncbi:MAG: cytochrome c3 family protein [Bacillota bacterium]|nr:cytochrome c3 family protein [Bacillota bacterium]
MNLMKRFKTYYYSFIGLIMLIASVFTFPSTVVFSAAGDPTITVNSPDPNTVLNPKDVVISGVFADTQQTPNPVFTADDNLSTTNPISDSTKNPSDWVIDLANGTWSYKPSAKSLSDGTHSITISITDVGTASTSITLIIDSKRPYISGSEIISNDNNQYTVHTNDTLGTIAQSKLGNEFYWTDIAQLNGLTTTSKDTPLTDGTIINLPTIRTGEDFTSIPQNATMKIQLTDDNQMNNLVSKIRNTTSPYNPINVMLGATQLKNGTATILENTASENQNPGKYIYDVYFTPADSLTLNKTYLVYLDPNLLDDANNHVYAKFFKFTTKSNTDWDDIDNQSHDSANPHGHYQLNTNMCSACHSSHVDSPYEKDTYINSQLNPSREGGSYLISFNEKLNAKASENYCTACHDGTLNNAPAASGIEGTYHHDNPVDYDSTQPNNLKEATACTSCHNPHLEWSASNPNLLKDHYVYTHKETIADQNGADKTTVDTLDTTCETCHEDDLIHDTNTVSSIFVKNQSTDGYSALSYKKSLTTNGTIAEYSLCLRCHQANKGTATDIQSYYLDAGSGHYFTLPSDDGGSQLNGAMPCAECHETHGSDNIKMLRGQLGNTLSDSKFTSSGTTWNAANERTFCLKCHNNSTEIYGKVGEFKTTDSNNNPITGHQSGDSQSCSSCHGTGSTDAEKFQSAAHAPKKTITP